MIQRILAVAMTAGLAIGLTACGSSADTASAVKITTDYRGLPKQSDGTQKVSTDGPSIHWATTAKQKIVLVTFGSGSCPVVPTSGEVKSSTRLVLHTKKYDGACTADLGPHTTVLARPAGLSLTKPVTVVLDTPNANETNTTLRLLPNVNSFREVPTPIATATLSSR